MRYNRQVAAQLTTWFLSRLGGHQHRTGWLRQGECPNCGKEKKYGMSVYLDRTNCFSCGYHPKPLRLLMKVEGLESYNEAYKFLGAFDEASLLDKPVKQLKQKFGKLPESYRLLTLGDSMYSKLARKYMKGRGYNITDLSMRGVGYCTSGKYGGRIIIPFYEGGKMVYFNARQFINVGEKHKNPPIEEFGIGKSLLIYNADCLQVYKKVYLVESATNSLTLGDKAFAIGGKKISGYQLSKVIKSPCKDVIMILDPDAYWEALKTGLTLCRYKRVKIVKLPDKKDVNDIGKKETLKLVKKSPWLTYKDIYKIYLNTERPLHHRPIA